MIKTPLSTVIGGAFWTPGCTIIGSSSQNLTQLIKSLFANQEQGFAYDPNDLTTLYQDAVGTIPVTAAGQPVGLMLDKSKGLVLGSELIPQPLNFNAWVKTAAVSETTENSFTTTALGGCTLSIFGSNSTKTYEIRVEGVSSVTGAIRNSSAGSIAIAIPAGNFDIVTKTPLLSNVGSSIYIALSGAGSITFDSISVKELAGNHAYQTVSASRPILQRNATTGAYYLAFDGADDSLQTNSIDFTATDKLNLFAGVRKSGDAVVGVLAETSANANNNVGAFYVLAPSTAGIANTSAIVRAATTFMSTLYTNPEIAVGIPYLLRFKSDIATNTLELSINAKQVSAWNKTEVGYSKMGNYPLHIGRRSTGVFPFNGHLYSLIGIGRLTSVSETIALEKSIAKNTGVTL